MIKRKQLAEYLALLELSPVLAITGPRQCGKTTLAHELSRQLKKNTIYLDMESATDRNKLTDPELYFGEHEDKCLIIDEIQFYPDLFPLMRSAIDKKRITSRFIILGSASPQLLQQSSESLAGRVIYKELSPFNLLEIGPDNQNKHWLRGGFPEAYLARNEKNAFVWLQNFINTYIQRDLTRLGYISSINIFMRFVAMLAHGQGDIFNQNNFARSLGVSSPTVKKYLYYLEEAYIVRVLQSYHFNTKKRLVKSPKVYIRDSGILHHISHIVTRDTLSNSVLIGASWEGYVLEQIIQLLDENISPYYYRTHHGSECDLVLERGNQIIAVLEVKYSNSPVVSKGFSISIADLASKRNFMITPSSDDYHVRKDIQVCSLRTFLENYITTL